MSRFKDKEGREWELPDFTEGHVIRIRKSLGFDLHLVIDGDEAENAKAFSTRGVASMLWFLLDESVKERGLTEEQFADGMNHEARVAATQALVETILSFYHGPDAGKKMAATFRPAMKNRVGKAIAALKKEYGDSPD